MENNTFWYFCHDFHLSFSLRNCQSYCWPIILLLYINKYNFWIVYYYNTNGCVKVKLTAALGLFIWTSSGSNVISLPFSIVFNSVYCNYKSIGTLDALKCSIFSCTHTSISIIHRVITNRGMCHHKTKYILLSWYYFKVPNIIMIVLKSYIEIVFLNYNVRITKK